MSGKTHSKGPEGWHRTGEDLAREARRESDGAAAALLAGAQGRRLSPWGAEAEEEGGEYAERMSALAGSFPGLARAPGARPWNPCALDDWAASVASSGERHAAAFVLWAVWNPSGPWRTPPFDLGTAWPAWDGAHRAAASAWLASPFFP